MKPEQFLNWNGIRITLSKDLKKQILEQAKYEGYYNEPGYFLIVLIKRGLKHGK